MIRLGFGKMSIKWIQSFFLSNKKDPRGTFLVYFFFSLKCSIPTFSVVAVALKSWKRRIPYIILLEKGPTYS